MKTNGIKYGIKSSKPQELNRRAKRKNITVQQLILLEYLQKT